jgi:hypothetical protein
MTSLETLDTKNTNNEHSFPLVTYMAYFDRQFGRCRILKSGYSAEQILDRLNNEMKTQL